MARAWRPCALPRRPDRPQDRIFEHRRGIIVTHFAELRAVWDELTAPGGRYETHVVKDGGVPRLASKAAAATLRDLWIDAAMRFADRPCQIGRASWRDRVCPCV